jgi:adenylate cyclase
MAFWNAPLPDAEHGRNACRAALAMLDDLARFNNALKEESELDGKPFTPVRMGIGINTGQCIVGNIGSPQRFDYSVLGDAVNVAARFEEATKTFGADIIIGERTAAEAADFALLELGAVALRGKDRPERIFALVGDEKTAASEQFQKLREAHAKLMAANQNASEQKLALAQCLKLSFPAIRGYYENYAVTRHPMAAGDTRAG